MKTCSKCKEIKDESSFSITKRGEGGEVIRRNSWCNSCKKKRHNEKHGITPRKKKFEDALSKECTKCNIVQDKGCFSVTARNLDGTVKHFASWCKTCVNNKEIEKRGGRVKKIPVVKEDSKECLDCGIIKHIDEYFASSKGRLGKMSYCKVCTKIRTQKDDNYREKGAAYTRLYRERHLFKWRAMHRIHQFNRRNKIKATEDGTLTSDVLSFIYRIIHCYWCKKETIPSERTLEHVQELSAGGIHGISNVRMACASCNSARKGKHNGRD